MRNRCLFLLLFVSAVPAPASSDTIELVFDVLPTATPGTPWTYFSVGGAAETSVFTATGIFLTMNSMGLGFNDDNSGGAGGHYRALGAVTAGVEYDFDIFARAVAVEGVLSNAFYGLGFVWGAAAGGQSCLFALTTADIRYVGPFGAVVVDTTTDTTIFHEYRVHGGAGTCELYVDGSATPLAVQPPRPVPIATNYVLFGDATHPSNAWVDIGRGAFCQDSVGPLVLLLDVLEAMAAIVDAAEARGLTSRKLTGTGGIGLRLSAAVEDFEDGRLSETVYNNRLGSALNVLRAFDNQVAAKRRARKIPAQAATALNALSAEAKGYIRDLMSP